jgi:HlyD family secretion protein
MIMPGRPADTGTSTATQKDLWVLRGGVAMNVPVDAGESNGTVTAITSGELAEGDLVITDRIDAK